MRPAKHDDGLRAAGSLCTHVVFAHTVQAAQSAHCLCPPSRLSRHSQSMQNFVLSRFRGLGQQAHRTRPDDARLQPWLQRWHNLGCLPSAIGCRSEHHNAPRSHTYTTCRLPANRPRTALCRSQRQYAVHLVCCRAATCLQRLATVRRRDSNHDAGFADADLANPVRYGSRLQRPALVRGVAELL